MGSLHDACRNNETSELLAFIAAGADLNARDKHSRTPLMMAAHNNAVNSIDILLANGAQVSLAAIDDVNALHFAAMKGHAEAAKHLLASGGLPVDCRTRKGLTALALAAQGGHVELMQLLIKKKASLTAVDKKQRSVLDLCKDEECRLVVREAMQEAKEKAEEKARSAREATGGGGGGGEKRKDRSGLRQRGEGGEGEGGGKAKESVGADPIADEGGEEEEGIVAGPSLPPQGVDIVSGYVDGIEQPSKKPRTSKAPLLSFGDDD